MLARGSFITTTTGSAYRVDAHLGDGGQGSAYRVAPIQGGVWAAAKVFSPTELQLHPATVERTAALVAANLGGVSQVLCGAPRELLAPPLVGHVATYVDCGVPLDRFVERHFVDRHAMLGLAAALAYAVDQLERRGIAHGDLSPRNLLVVVGPDGIARLALIDFDAASLPRVPGPSVIGTPLYIAPEILSGVGTVGLESDRFTLAVLLHVLLTGRHPAAPYLRPGATTVTQARVLARDAWVVAGEEAVGGLSPCTLSRRIRRMLRRGLFWNPAARPSAGEWYRVLREALEQLWLCSRCDVISFDDPERDDACPFCSERCAPPRIVLASGADFEVPAGACVTLGRRHLGGAADLDEPHVELLREGWELRLRDRSRNGVFMLRAGEWRRIPDRWLAVRPGDRLRFGAQTEATTC